MSVASGRRVCVVIISHNSGDTLGRCLDCLGVQTYRDFDVILLDNASRERPGPLVSDRPFPVSYMEMADNLGFAEGMNTAMAATSAPYVVALNPDAYAEPDWLAALVAAADTFPAVAAFGSLQLSAQDDRHIDGFGDHYLLTGQAWRGRTWPTAHSGGHPEYTFGVCAAAALYRADAVRDAGGFDRRYFCFYEDVDLSFRLRLAGHHCAVIRNAVVRHVGGASFTGQSAFAEYLIARNEWWTLIKNMPLALLWIAVPGYLAIQLLAAIKSRRPARLKGVREALSRTDEFLASRREIQARRKISVTDMARWLAWRPSLFFGKVSVIRNLDR